MSKMERFARLPTDQFVGGSKVANRVDFYGNPPLSLRSVGGFVSRLWALYGPPDHVGDEGFTYNLIDHESGLRFRAYAAGSGPAYGAASAELDVIEAFERLVAATSPAECEIAYETDFGRYASGARAGLPFDEKVKRQKKR
jgi:hypothetical protein